MNDSYIEFENDTISIDAWIKLDVVNSNNIYQIVGSGDSGISSFRFQIFNGCLQFVLNDQHVWRNVISGNTILLPDTWYHVALAYNGTNATIYLNGNVDSTRNITYKILTNYNDIHIGSMYINSSSSAYEQHQFLGIIDELRISKSYRTSEEIINYYNQTK